MGHYAARLLFAIKRAEQATQQAKEQALREYGITPAQQAALTILGGRDGTTSAELARQCQVTPQTMNSTVGRLESRGLVTRAPHPTHRSLVELRLTEQGREVFERTDARIAALDSDLAAGFTPAERDILRDLLGRVVENAPQAAEARPADHAHGAR